MKIKSRKKTTKWNILFHYYAIIFSVIWGILLVPLYLKYIPLEIYGAWLATGNIISWLTVVDPGISDVLRQKVGLAYGASEINKLNDLLVSGSILNLLVSLMLLIIGLILSNFVPELLKLNSSNIYLIIKNAFILSVISGSLLIFSFGFTSFNQGLLSSVGIGTIYVIATISSLLINILLLFDGYGLYSIPISGIFRALILIIGNLIYIFWRYNKESIIFNFSYKEIKNLLKLISYNFLGKLGNILSTQVDIFLVARYLGTETAPVLSLTRKGPELTRMLVERPPTAMLPAITNAWGAKEYDKVKYYTFRLFLILLWITGLIVTGFILLNKYFVTLWVGNNLFAGEAVNIAIVISLILSMVINIFSNIYFSIGKIKDTSKINFIQSIITISFSFIGVIYFGLFGLVIAQGLSFFFLAIWYFPIKVVKLISYDKEYILNLIKELIIITSTNIIIIIFLYNLIQIPNWVSFLLFTFFITLIYVISLFLASNNFRKEIKHIFKIIIY